MDITFQNANNIFTHTHTHKHTHTQIQTQTTHKSYITNQKKKTKKIQTFTKPMIKTIAP